MTVQCNLLFDRICVNPLCKTTGLIPYKPVQEVHTQDCSSPPMPGRFVTIQYLSSDEVFNDSTNSLKFLSLAEVDMVFYEWFLNALMNERKVKIRGFVLSETLFCWLALTMCTKYLIILRKSDLVSLDNYSVPYIHMTDIDKYTF